MTRKRCVKLLMAKGYTRNGANIIATEAMIAYGSYAKGYEQVEKIKIKLANMNFSVLRDVFDRVCTTVSELMPMIQELAREVNALNMRC